MEMNKRQMTLIEDEINTIQRRIDEATRFAEADSFWGNDEQAARWQNVVTQEVARLNGIAVALACIGYNMGWQNDKHVIIPA